MLNRFIHIAFLLALAHVAGAQYLQGNLQGGPPAPGTRTRSPINSLERAANNLPGATIVTDTYGNQRFAYYVRVLDSCLNYNPTTFVGAMPPSTFVYQCGTEDSLFYIDWKGDAVLVSVAGTCDEDWLQISDNSCPDALTDSIYKYKYVAIGARLVWPTAELLLSDSTGKGMQVISGSRNSGLGFYDNFNQVYSSIDQSGASTIWYINPTGEWRVVTAGGGTVQTPGAPFVNQFAIDPNDSPLPTVQAHLYPYTRVDTNTVRNFVYTDNVGKFRVRPLDSLELLMPNLYNTNDTTTNLLRSGFILRSLWFRGLDTIGFIRWSVRPDGFIGGQLTVYQDSIVADNDTIIWNSSWHPELQVHDFNAEGTYFHVDSTKVWGVGQFPDFTIINLVPEEKGFYYVPGEQFVGYIMGDATTGYVTYSYALPDQSFTSTRDFTVQVVDLNQPDFSTEARATIGTDEARAFLDADETGDVYGGLRTGIIYRHDEERTAGFFQDAVADGSVKAAHYLGVGSPTGVYFLSSDERRAEGFQTIVGSSPFDWYQVLINDDTSGNKISFYNRAYYLPNSRPSNTNGNIQIIGWQGDGTNAGKNPVFLDYNATVKANGTATLVGGTVTVNTGKVATGDKIMISCNTTGGTQGILSAPTGSIVNGTSFVINSSSGTDTSTVNWIIID